MEIISARLLWEIFKHVRSWLANLDRASDERKRQSTRALRRIVTASRQTSVYLRQLEHTGVRDHAFERELATRWTELGFELEDLGLDKLAAKCQIEGKHWADPGQYERAFLAKADSSLDRMEQAALEILREADGERA